MAADDWHEADCDNGCRPLPGSKCCPTCEPPDDWYDRIACQDHPLDLFFGGITAERAALRICATCPVRPYCLEKGWEEDFGTWGGMPQGQRVSLRESLKLDRVPRRQRRRTIREIATKPLETR